ncbi:MAG TPA: TonB-dependent receptor [Chitinophagaceae bacterium]|nr:TonB-dependent receptor [Chitinophagaceae bacterium]
MKKYLLLITCLFAVLSLLAQRTVSGKVTDENGNPIANASVTVKETGGGVSTDASGNFSLRLDPKARTLVFSYIGKASEEIVIGNQSVFNARLKQEGGALDEVVVVAYGTQIKKRVTGAIAKVDGSDLENKPFTSVDQMLQGKVAGLQSTSPTGQPGGIQQVRIRGIGSITAGAAPLYVIDGVPVNTGDFSRLNNTSNALAGLNPNDIESVSVLKDAASASIYGSRAANGVVLITTKKGRAGKSKIRIDSEFGFGNTAYVNDLSKPLNREEYFTLTREGLVNAGATQGQIDATLNTLGFNNTANEDWVEHVTRQGTTQNINASLSGGDAKTTFYTSAGFFDQKAVVIGSDFRRYSGTFNIKHKATSKLSVGINTTGSYIHQNSPSQSSAFRNPVAEAFWLRPSQNAYNADGSLNYSTTTFNQLYNPLAVNAYDRIQLNNVKVLANFTGDYQFYRDLKFTTKFGIDFINIEEERYDNPFFGDSRTVGGRMYNYDTRVANWLWSNLLNYRHDFLNSKALGVDFTIGYEAQKSKQYNITTRGEGVPATTNIPLPVPSSPSVAQGARTDYSFVSLLSMLQVNYKSKYSLSGSIRRDGSSRFGSNNKYGTFWSVGAAWNLEQENFVRHIKFINALKLRASYGVNGNAEIGNYTWKGTYIFNANYNQQPGSAPNQVENPDLTWEINKPFNVGIDAVVWDGRVTLNADYYIRNTENLILNDPLSRTSGFNSVSANVGSMENKGWEFQVNIIPVRTKNFTWDLSFNIALNKNKITSLRNNADILGLPFIRRVGEDFQSIYTRLWAGVDPANGNPLWFVDDTKSQTTNNVTTVQRAIIGSASPKGFGSFSTALNYKGFTLDAQFNYQYGNIVYDNWGFIGWSDGFNPQLNKIRKQLGRWQNPGDIADIPKYVYGGAMVSNAESSRWYYKGDFIRLRDLTISYQLPKNVTDAVSMDNVRFYVRGTNLWTKAFDKEITFDPEQPINGVNDLQILIQRTISIGLSLGF